MLLWLSWNLLCRPDRHALNSEIGLPLSSECWDQRNMPSCLAHFLILDLFYCFCAWVHQCIVEEGIASPGTGLEDSCELPHERWIDLGPLQKQPELLTSEPTLQLSLSMILRNKNWKNGDLSYTISLRCL